MTQSAWCRLRVIGVTPGATYESETFDQYVFAAAPDGTAVELFDMAPMVGGDRLTPGVDILALVAVDAHTGFGPGGADGTVVASVAVQLQREDIPTVRAEVFDRSWALVAYHGSLPVLLASDRLKGHPNVANGTPLTWREAVFVLMGWRSAAT